MAVLASFDTTCMSDDQVTRLCDWLRGLGHDPADFRTYGALHAASGGYELHLHKVRRDEHGNMISDPFVVHVTDGFSPPLALAGTPS